MTRLVARNVAMPGRLQSVSLALAPGEFVGLIGPNGSGKTSLLQGLAGIPPAIGEVMIEGQRAGSLPPDHRQQLFTFLPASRDVIWPLKARDFINLALPPGSDWNPLAERLELAALLDRRMDRLSTGERTRVMVARALAPDPLVMLLDEPIANLDPYWQQAVLEEIKRRVRSFGRTAVLAIHDLAAAHAYGSRLILMNDGVVAADANPEELRESGLLEKVFRVSPDWLDQVRPADRRSLP